LRTLALEPGFLSWEVDLLRRLSLKGHAVKQLPLALRNLCKPLLRDRPLDKPSI